MSNELEIDDVTLEHVGVKGMKWGVRKQSVKAAKPKRMTPAMREAHRAKMIRRRKIGYEITTGVLISVGAVGLAAVAGPFAAAGASAAARTVAQSYSASFVDTTPNESSDQNRKN